MDSAARNVVGQWDDRHLSFLAELRGTDLVEWSRVLLDSGTVKAPLGGESAETIRPIETGRQTRITC